MGTSRKLHDDSVLLVIDKVLAGNFLIYQLNVQNENLLNGNSPDSSKNPFLYSKKQTIRNTLQINVNKMTFYPLYCLYVSLKWVVAVVGYTVCLLIICKGFHGISLQPRTVGLVILEIFAENHCISLVNWL